MVRVFRFACVGLAVLLASACMSIANTVNNSKRTIILLGEVHDNAEQHSLRASRFRALLESGARPALLLEQFDRERQADIDNAVAKNSDADTVISAATRDTKTGWNWAFYKPFIALALQYQLPIIAVNVSRSDAGKIYSSGLATSGFNAIVPADIAAAQTREIHQNHCGMISLEQAAQMSNIQVARDQFMARQIQVYAPQGVVLLAGNGHIRKDIGVPRWLPQAVLQNTQVIAYLEGNSHSSPVFDQVITTAAQARDDPCKVFQEKR